jgi:zinc transport system substrate-binding protein
VVWVGESLESYLLKPLQTEGVANLELIDTPGIDAHPYGEEEHEHAEGEAAHEDEAADAHAHEGEEEAEHHEMAGAEEGEGHAHEHTGLDPHVWLDPLRAQTMVAAIAETLAGLDAENAARYRANAETASAELTALNEEVAARLAPVAGKPFITFHDGYSYFVERYGLNQVGQVAVHPERMPGAASVRELRETIAAEGVSCAFAEPQYDAGAIQALAGDAALKVGALDATGAGLEPGPSLYAALIRQNAAAVEACLLPTS